jgi:GNAT superfamily N-acetyltransferase
MRRRTRPAAQGHFARRLSGTTIAALDNAWINFHSAAHCVRGGRACIPLTALRCCALVVTILRIDMRIAIKPLTRDNWLDLVELFDRRGASIARGCYCMCYRRSGKHEKPPGITYSESNKRALKALVDRGVVPGLVGYEDGRPIGWVSLGPREDYAKLARSPVMKPVDQKPVWSIVCFFVDAKARHRRVADALLKGAVVWAKKQGVALLEAYPQDKRRQSADDSMWFGSKAMFDRTGFVEVARRRPLRPVVRKTLRAR